MRYLILAAALFLAGCEDAPPEDRARGRQAYSGIPVEIARHGDMRIFQMTVRRIDSFGNRRDQQLYIIPNASVVWEESEGKTTTTRVTSSGSPALSGLMRLTEAERTALGLPPANDPRVTALAKLTDEEKRALGLEQIERDLLRRP